MRRMIDAKQLLERFLGQGGGSFGQMGGQQGRGSSPWSNPMGQQNVPARGGAGRLPSLGGGLGGLADAAKQVLGGGGRSGGGFGGSGAMVGGAAAAGVLGLLMGKKKGLGGVLSHGGAALLGALAHRAYQNYQAGQPPAATAAAPLPQPGERVDARFLPEAAPAADGGPFDLALIRAMIAAAKADGHVDAEEQRRIFARVEELGLDAEAKAMIFDALAAPIGVSEVAASARTPEQAAELYLASRLALDPDDASERAYLAALAHRLKLPAELVAHLDGQAAAVSG